MGTNAVVDNPVHLAASADTKSSDEWAVLGGMRFVLACIVMCYHMGVYVGHSDPVAMFGKLDGFIAVIAFFAISGYSMAHSLERDPNPGRFYERRFWRIYPLYLFALLLAYVPAGIFLFLHPVPDGGFGEFPQPREFALSLVFLQGIAMGMLPGNGVLWSLNVEAWLYVVSPALARLKASHLAVMGSLSAAAFVLYNRFGHTPYSHASHGVALIGLSWAFVAGFALYRFRDKMRNTAAVIIVAIALACDLPSREQFGSVLIAAAAYVLWNARSFRMSLRARKVLTWLGDVSFPLYVVHIPILEMCGGFNVHSGAVMAACCLTFAVITYYVIDSPVRAYVKRSRGRRRTPDLQDIKLTSGTGKAYSIRPSS